eukprot:CAMPEP_0202858370 /NCGR_PEP_ID=MMETSP1391-20130828/936_1 /ASSEMBLY_ACC=CAM_ASM_000867 /TAXON_ID=1034604 /ORGANISM="Chlamydomonas leiostraca, Strain SAG 11-49" /LENGTH=81 /DNA_ID=CAMNT_0049537285 /DNA_START=46 /DNA_END=292 /DNA_ORIENTATION=-
MQLSEVSEVASGVGGGAMTCVLAGSQVPVAQPGAGVGAVAGAYAAGPPRAVLTQLLSAVANSSAWSRSVACAHIRVARLAV